jgi:hypothetical protein
MSKYVKNIDDQLDATITLYEQLNMFRAIIRPSSGAHDCGFLTAYGIVS